MQRTALRRLAIVLCTGCLLLGTIQPSFAEKQTSSTSTTSLKTTRTTTTSHASKTVQTTGPEATAQKNWWSLTPKMREILSRFAPALSFYYSRSVADSASSDFGHTLGFVGALDYAATDNLILSTDLALYRQLGEEYERFVASNWNFSVTRTVKLPHAGILYPKFLVKLPTNPDDREYLTYLGSLGFDVELRKSSVYPIHKDHRIGASAGLSTMRHIFDKTASENGSLNRIWQVSAYASLNYKFRDWAMLIFKFRNSWNWFVEGKRANDSYYLSTALHVSPYKQFWLALALISQDRTFLYDQTSFNVSFWRPEATSVVVWLTYLPRLSKTHELSR